METPKTEETKTQDAPSATQFALGTDDKGRPMLMRHKIEKNGVMTIELDLVHMPVFSARGLLLQVDEIISAWYTQMAKLAEQSRIVPASSLTQGMRNFVGRLRR